MTRGLYGWDYAVAQQLVDDDQEIGAVYPARPDLFPGFLDKKWGRPFLQDAFATKLYSPIMPDYPFAVIELCQCFPDDLHIADVELSDIRRKLEQPQNGIGARGRSEEHTFELQSLMRTSYAVFCLKKKNIKHRCKHT